MPEEKKEQPIVSGVTEDTYASMLSEAIKSKDAEIASLKAAQATRVQELTNLVLNGGAAEDEGTKKEENVPSRLDCYKKYKQNDFSTNLEYWENFIELRDATIREYGKDPLVTGNYGFDAKGERVEPEPGEADSMEATINTIKQFIEESEGDPVIFNMKMNAALK